MKILTLVSDLEKGGVQRVSQNFADGYKKLGLDSRLVAVNGGGSRENDLKDLDIEFWLGFNNEVLKQIKYWNPDVIHIHTSGIEIHHVRALKKVSPNAIFIEKNVFSTPSKWQHLLTYSFQMSYWCEWKYNSSFRSNKNIVEIAPNPVKVENFYSSDTKKVFDLKRNLNIPKNNIVVGRVGQAFSGKWSPILINSFDQICRKYKNIFLILVNPPLEIIKQASNSIFSKKIKIINEVFGDDDLRDIYTLIDIFALAADQGESFGNVLAESLLCKTPAVVLSTPWGDNSQCEVVGNMVGGLVALSTKGFKNALLRLIMDENLRKKLGAQGRERIISTYEQLLVCKLIVDKLETKFNRKKSTIKSSNILKIYNDSIEKSNFLTKTLINFSILISLTRITSGYQNIKEFFLRYFKIFVNKFRIKI